MARIMIVDQNRDSADMLGLAVSIIGHEAIPAYGGAHAIDLLAAELPDLMLLDLRMSEMSGYETLRRLKAGRLTQELPVIVITASAEADVEKNVIGAGASGYLAKPVSLASLQAKIEQWVA